MAAIAGLERDASGLVLTDAGVGAFVIDRGLPRVAGALAIGAGPVAALVAGLPRNTAGRVVTVDVATAVAPTLVAGLLRSSAGELVTATVGPFTDVAGVKRTAAGALGVA